MLGSLEITRKYVDKNYGTDNGFLYYTSVKDTKSTSLASLIMIHGFGESQDQFLESAIQYGLNGIHVHLIDLTGFGYTSGVKMALNTMQVFMQDIGSIFPHVNPDLPCFIYGHSMGGLAIASFLMNNPGLNIAGAILSAPLLAFK